MLPVCDITSRTAEQPACKGCASWLSSRGARERSRCAGRALRGRGRRTSKQAASCPRDSGGAERRRSQHFGARSGKVSVPVCGGVQSVHGDPPRRARPEAPDRRRSRPQERRDPRRSVRALAGPGFPEGALCSLGRRYRASSGFEGRSSTLLQCRYTSVFRKCSRTACAGHLWGHRV